MPQIPADGEAAAVAQAVAGISFTTGVVASVLPLVPEDELLLPPPYELRVLQQPQKRPKRRALANFKIWTAGPAQQASAGTDSCADGSVVPALKLEGAASAASPVGSNPSSRPTSSRAGAAAEDATGVAPAPTHPGSSKGTPRGKSLHGAGSSHNNNKPPAVLEDTSQDTAEVNK